MGGRGHDVYQPSNERSRPDHAARQSRFGDNFNRSEKPWVREDRRDGYVDERGDRRGERDDYDYRRPVEDRYRDREEEYGRMGPPPNRLQRPANTSNMMHGACPPPPGPVQAMHPYPTGNDRNGVASNGRKDLFASPMSGIGLNGPPLNAPRGPKSQGPQRAPSKSIDQYRPSDVRPRVAGSQRSASPRRENQAYQPVNFRDRKEPFVQQHFGDPYLKADHFYERVSRGRPPKDDTPEYLPKLGWSESRDVVRSFVEHFVGHEIAPDHINAHFFEALREASPAALKCLARALNALSGHTHGNLYFLNYSKLIHRGTTERKKWLVAGAIVVGPSIGICYKKAIGIESLDRAHSQWGTLCVKDKHALILEVVGKRAYVLWVTSFQGREDPKYNDERKFYFRLAHKDEETPPSKAQDVEVVRYGGGCFLDRGTFIHWSEPEWVDLDVTPLAMVGGLCKDQYAAVARIMSLPEQHQLRVRGKLEVTEPDADNEEQKSAEKAKLKEAQEKVELDGNDEDLMPEGDA